MDPLLSAKKIRPRPAYGVEHQFRFRHPEFAMSGIPRSPGTIPTKRVCAIAIALEVGR